MHTSEPTLDVLFEAQATELMFEDRGDGSKQELSEWLRTRRVLEGDGRRTAHCVPGSVDALGFRRRGAFEGVLRHQRHVHGHNAEVGRHLQDQLKFSVYFENAPAFITF